MTTKSELIEYLKEKKGVKPKKIEQAWAEKEAEVKESGIVKPEEIEAMTMRKISLYFRKLTSVNDEVELKVIPIGLTSETDYGAKSQYDEAISVYKKDMNKAILEGYTNEAGTPLWRNTGITSKKGKPIQWEKEVRRNLYCLAKRDEDTVWKLGVMSLSGKLLKEQIKLGVCYETTAVIGKATKEVWDNSRIIMYGSDNSELNNPKKTEQPVKEMIEAYAKDIIIPFKDIDTRAREEKAQSDYFFVSVNIVQTSESMASISNRVTFSDPEDLLFDEDKQLTGWIAEDVELNIVDEAMDVLVLMNSSTYMKKQESGVEEEVMKINVFGLFADADYIKTEENTPTVGNEGQETTTPTKKPETVEEEIKDAKEQEVKDW